MAVYKVTGGYLEVEAAGNGNGGDGSPPGTWGGAGEPFPTPPIVLPIPPGAIQPDPPIPAHPIYIPVYPAHPIVIPPGAIGPGDPPIPAHPIVLPPFVPAHPIVIPPDSVAPGVPTHPIVLPPPPSIWPGRPTHPIVLPPEPPVGGDPQEGKWVYSAVYGWVWDPGPGGKPQPLP